MKLNYLLVFLMSFLLSFLATRWAISLGFKLRILDEPDPRKVHDKPIPRTGGLGLLMGNLAGISAAYLLMRESSGEPWVALIWILISSFALGFIDDKYQLRALHKLIGQVFIAVIAWSLGLRVSFITNFIPWLKGEFIFLSPALSFSFTVLWLVSLMNAMNLIDGLDGLLAGISAITSTAMLSLALLTGRATVALLSLALMGSSFGFLVYNFHPAKVFLGDSGSLQIGAMLGAISIIGPLKTATLLTLAPVMLIFALPIGDTFLAILRRLLKGRPIFSPDKEHIHHVLLRKGLSQVQAVLLLYALTFMFSLLGIFLSSRIYR